jgi:hypothetical protein
MCQEQVEMSDVYNTVVVRKRLVQKAYASGPASFLLQSSASQPLLHDHNTLIH